MSGKQTQPLYVGGAVLTHANFINQGSFQANV
jgi:hypothetical protein